MAIEWEFVQYTTDGSKFISLDQWAATLTEDEQEEFRQADKRQKEYRAIVVEQGNLVVENNSYIWRDELAEQISKPYDPTWLDYWNRWQVETTSTCRINRKEI
jgi:hypothetical protein